MSAEKKPHRDRFTETARQPICAGPSSFAQPSTAPTSSLSGTSATRCRQPAGRFRK